MMKKRFYSLGLILLLVIMVLLLPSGCDTYEAPPVELWDVIQGRYTIEGEEGVVAYLDLSNGRYSVIPLEDSETPLEELGLFFFGENPEGTYTIQHYADGISEKTTPGDLDKNGRTTLLSMRFESSVSDHVGESITRSLSYYDLRITLSVMLSLDIWGCAFVTEYIWKPWE